MVLGEWWNKGGCLGRTWCAMQAPQQRAVKQSLTRSSGRPYFLRMVWRTACGLSFRHLRQSEPKTNHLFTGFKQLPDGALAVKQIGTSDGDRDTGGVPRHAACTFVSSMDSSVTPTQTLMDQ